MAAIDLSSFGHPVQVDLRNHVSQQWSDGNGLVVLFGEYHDDRDMITTNLIDCCALIDSQRVACVGVEDRIHYPFDDSRVQGERQSLELYRRSLGDEEFISHVWNQNPGRSRFGRLLSFLRSDLRICSVEDQELHDEVWRIRNRFDDAEHTQAEKDAFDQEWPNLPNQYRREEKFVENLFTLWDSVGGTTSGIAILNTGSHHSRRCADRIKAMGVSYLYLSSPRQ